MIFGDFPTKSSSLVFNFWEAENLLFHILVFQGPSGAQLIRGKIPRRYFHETKRYSFGITQREPRGQKWTRWRAHPLGRATQAIFGLEHRLGPTFIWEAPYREKTYAIFFPRFIEVAAEAKVLSYSGTGQILLLRGRQRRGNRSHHHHLRDPLHPPHSL